MVTIGEKAPDFRLNSTLDKPISLNDYAGKKHVVRTFYPLDFSPVCSLQLPEYSGRKADFEKHDAEVLGVSRDSVYTHKAWAREFGIDVTLLADMNGETATNYGVYRPEANASKRAVFLIDKNGILRFQYVEKSPAEFTLRADDILAELTKL